MRNEAENGFNVFFYPTSLADKFAINICDQCLNISVDLVDQVVSLLERGINTLLPDVINCLVFK